MIAIAPFGISGTQKAITPARAAILRSGAGRSGWPVLQGARVPLYALSNVARSAATRSNYTSARCFVAIGGIHVGAAPGSAEVKIVGALTISDILNETPNRATFRVRGVIPRIGQDVIVTLGSKNNGSRLFGGQILTTDHGYTDTPANYHVDVAATDWTWSLNQRLITARWTGTPAATIAAALVTLGAPGYTSANVAADLPVLDEFTVTNQTTTAALTALARRVGGYWYVDERKDVHVFLTETAAAGTPPVVLSPAHPTLTELLINQEGGSLVTRVFVEGGGAGAHTRIVPGETKIPVLTATWYDARGGAVVSGPQRITYTGRSLGGGGSLVGPGAAPSAFPNLTLAPGAGIEAGVHGYAIAFLTATGSSLVGPRVAIACGLVPPPLTAPTAGAPLVGAGPDPGTHHYAITYVTASGETLPGPLLSVTTGPTAPPASAPAPSVAAGAGVDPGPHEYACTFVTAAGETTAGPISGVIMASLVGPAPPASAAAGAIAVGAGVDTGLHEYAVTYTTGAGETTPGPNSSGITTGPVSVNDAGAPTVISNGPNSTQGDLTVMNAYDYAATFSLGASSTDLAQQTAVVAASAQVNALASSAGGGKASHIVVAVPFATSAAVRWVHLYRRNRTTQTANVSSFRLHSSYANQLGTPTFQVSDGIGDSVITAKPAPPAGNTAVAAMNVITVTGIPTSPDGTVTGRKLYRRSGGAGYRLVAAISGNTQSTYTDNKANAALGAAPPASSTAGTAVARVTVANIPKGDSTIAGRNLYRRSGGAGLRFLVALANNTTTTYTDTTPNASLGAAPPATASALACQVPLTLPLPPAGSALVVERRLYRTAANQSELRLVAPLDIVTTAGIDTAPDSALGAAAPTTATASANRVNLSGIPIGAASVTARVIYRTAADQSPLKLLATLADNTTTTYADTAPDSALGAAAPSSDVSGLAQPAGNVNAGSPTCIVAGAAAFEVAGGWAVIGNGEQVIRYQTITGSSLTGIPASGPGAIVASIAYNSTITAAPQLTGIPASGAGAIIWPIERGQDINVWVQVDDPAAQATVAALLTSPAAGPHAGVIEEALQDRRLSITEARARGRAYLELRKNVLVRIRYHSQDLNTRAGRTIHVRILTPPYDIDADFTIQTVTIGNFHPALAPTFTVEAAAVQFNFEDLVRRMSQNELGAAR